MALPAGPASDAGVRWAAPASRRAAASTSANDGRVLDSMPAAQSKQLKAARAGRSRHEMKMSYAICSPPPGRWVNSSTANFLGSGKTLPRMQFKDT